MQILSSESYQFGPYLVDVPNSSLLCQGRLLPLPPKAFDLLVAFVKNPGRVLSKREIMRLLWPESHVEESNLTQQVFILRKALGRCPDGSHYIETVPKRGYRFTADVRVAGVQKARSLSAGMALEPGGISVYPHRVIAVLPFRVLYSSGGDGYLGLSLADSLITKLSRLGPLLVRPTSAIQKYLSPEQDLELAGRELKADLLLEGSVRRHADSLLVTAQLVEVSRGAPVWSGIFSEQAADLLRLEDVLTDAMVNSLAQELTGFGQASSPGLDSEGWGECDG